MSLEGANFFNAYEGSAVITGTVHGPVVSGRIYGHVGAIGNQAKGSIVIGSADLSEVMSHHRDQLLDELERLRLAVMGEDLEEAIEEAKEAVQAGDQDTAKGVLRRLGRNGMLVARDLGINLLAAVIAAQLRIGG